ncbi:hypothetical protein GCM10022276_12340 [Sphingomonas limnosediminicola]|uniref:Uncharacterized protein n=1 Tax=Sphingomonas limnosediminicola TaxID=940133 RepID=A0ABP7L7U7_9SPHN
MVAGAIWKRYLPAAGIIHLALAAPSLAQVVQNRTVEFPGGGTKNNNGVIGPFCCTGETAIIHDTEGKPAGYIYFYDFSGGRILDPSHSVASTVSILVSNGADPSTFPAARFAAETWAPGATATVVVAPITYEIGIEPDVVTIDGHKYFNMQSLKARVRVSSTGVASVTAQPAPDEATAKPAPEAVEPTAAQAPAAPEVLPTLDESLEIAAAEFVAEKYPMTSARKLAAINGDVLQPCDMKYPDTSMEVDDTPTPSAAGTDSKIGILVDSIYIRDNLQVAGVQSDAIDRLIKAYRSDRIQQGRPIAIKFAQVPQAAIGGEVGAAVHAPHAPVGGLTAYHGAPAVHAPVGAIAGAQLSHSVLIPRTPEEKLIASLNALGLPRALPFKRPEQCYYTMSLTIRTPYRFALAPNNGRLFLIPRFSFQVCQARKVKPYDRTVCDNWVEVGSGQRAKLFGRYAYSAEWPDGRVTRDVMDFGADGPDVETINVVAP